VSDIVKRDERITLSSTSFLSLLRISKIKSFIINWSFFFSVVAFILTYLKFKNTTDFSKLAEYYSNIIASVSATLLGIVLAGLAILIALMQGKVLGLLLRKNVLQKFLFPFWIIAASWAISVLLSVSMYLFYEELSTIYVYVLSTESFVFTYSLLGSISLMGHSIKLGIMLAELSAVENSKE